MPSDSKSYDGKDYYPIGPGVYISGGNGDGQSIDGTTSTNSFLEHSTSTNTNAQPISSPGLIYTPDLRSFPTIPSPTTPLWNLSPEWYRMQLYQQEKVREEQERRQQEASRAASINAALDSAASAQYKIMDKLYSQGGLDAMRKEYYRVAAGTEGPYSVYAKAAYNALATKEKEEVINTPAVTKGANEYYEKGGINSLRGLVNYYENNGYTVYANIAKQILKQKEKQEQECERIKQFEEKQKEEQRQQIASTLEKELKNEGPKSEEITSKSPIFNTAIQEAERVLALYNVKLSRKKLIAIFKTHPDLQVSSKGIIDSLIQIGRLDDCRTGGRSSDEQAVIKGVQRFVHYNFNTFVKEARSSSDKISKAKPSKIIVPKLRQDKGWRFAALDFATQKILEVLESKGIGLPNEKIRRAFEKQPALQGSREQVQQNLIALGKADGPVKNNRSAFERGLEKVFLAVLNNLVGKAHASEISPSVLTRDPKNQEKQHVGWWSVAVRAFRGERTPEVLNWQRYNREISPYIVAFFGGIHDGSEIFDERLRNYKVEMGRRIEGGIKSVNQELQGGNLNESQVVLHTIKRMSYKTAGVVVDTVLPESMADIRKTLLLTTGGAALLTKTVNTTDKLLFLYRNHKKAEKLMKSSPANRIQHETLRTQYRQSMEKPIVEDAELFKMIDKLYRTKAQLGSGSTADPVRYEISTGKPIESKFYIEKSQQMIQLLEKWLKNNPNASPNDRAVVENIILDLKDAIGQKQWYPQTKSPKY